jgi:cellulose 1,4-beta-cellobiosidase
MINKKYCAAAVVSLFLVMSCGKGGEGGKSGTEGEVKATPTLIAVPAAPAGVSAVSGINRITVKWQPALGAASYTVYYSDKPGATKTHGEKIAGITAVSYEHTGVKEKTMYYYVVTASNESGESPPSAESGAMVQAIALQAPVNVSASGGDGRITVKWKEVAGATSYTIYYATTPGASRAAGNKIADIKSISYQLANVKKKTMYFFKVTAVNAAGESPASNESGAMP